MSSTYKFDLTQEEAVLLKGLPISRPEIVALIDQACRDQSAGLPQYFGEILRKAQMSGWLRWRPKQITVCSICDARYGYHAYRRTNRRKGEIRGKTNHNAPKTISGWTFDTDYRGPFIRFTITGYEPGVCPDCWGDIKPKLLSAIVDNELPVDFNSNEDKESLFVYTPTLICFDCGEESPEVEFKKLPALMSGSYPCECPHCGAKHLPFGKSHKSGHIMVRKITQE